MINSIVKYASFHLGCRFDPLYQAYWERVRGQWASLVASYATGFTSLSLIVYAVFASLFP